MPELKGQKGEVKMTVVIKRKATGKEEVVHLVGTLEDPAEIKPETKEV